MKFKELKVGSQFKIARFSDNLTYTKVNNRPHYNAKWRSQFVSIHGNTEVKEIKKWEIIF